MLRIVSFVRLIIYNYLSVCSLMIILIKSFEVLVKILILVLLLIYLNVVSLHSNNKTQEKNLSFCLVFTLVIL